MTLVNFYAEIKGLQSLIGSFLGFFALTWGALYNYRLGRKRDDVIREKEIIAVALGIYSEVVLISKELSKFANIIGQWYLKYAQMGSNVPKYYSDTFVLPQTKLFDELSEKLGVLPPEILMPIARFYGYYGQFIFHFPNVLENDERKLSYGVEWVLNPAISAIDDVQTALREIEKIGGIMTSLPPPDLKSAREAINLIECLYVDATA